MSKKRIEKDCFWDEFELMLLTVLFLVGLLNSWTLIFVIANWSLELMFVRVQMFNKLLFHM